jgi:glyoxylase-like metal-dependent hydrolase (beta-lactamase superfamily II)
MEEVIPGIFLIKEKSGFERIKPSENVYIIAGPDGLIFDAGFGNKKVVKFFIKEINKIEQLYRDNKEDFKITRIIVSHGHPDHFAGLKKIKNSLGVKIILTKKTADIIKNKKSFMKSFNSDSYEDYLIIQKGFRYRMRSFLEKLMFSFFFKRIYGLSFIANPDEIIKVNTEISINGEYWKVFPSPGHAVDHISLYNEEKGILLSGDNVLSKTTWLGPPNCNIVEYIKSIETIQKLPNLKIILAAHGALINNPRERIIEILKHRKERTQQVLDIVKEFTENGTSPDEIIQKLYPNKKKMRTEIARGWVCLTLKMLEEQNVIKIC